MEVVIDTELMKGKTHDHVRENLVSGNYDKEIKEGALILKAELEKPKGTPYLPNSIILSH